MKFILLLALVGFVAAWPARSVHDEACERIQHAKLLAKVDRNAAIETLQETLDQLLQDVKDKLDNGIEVGNKLLDKIEEVTELLKKMGADFGVKAKELFNKIKESYKNFFYNAFKNLFGWGKLPVDHRGWFDWLEKYKETLKHLLQMINDHIDVEQIKQYIADKIGDGMLSNMLLDQLAQGMNRLKELLTTLINYLEGGKSSKGLFDLIETIFDKIKEVLKKFKDALFNNWGSFSEWVKENWDKAMEEAGTIKDKVKLLAELFLKSYEGLSEETKKLALEFFSLYKDELGHLFHEIEAIVNGNKGASEIQLRGFLDKYKEYLKNLLQMINDNVDVEQIREYIQDKIKDSFLGNLLLDQLTGGLNRLKELLTKLIDYLEGRSPRGLFDLIEEIWDKIKEALKKFKEALFNNWGSFSEWVKEIWDKGMEEAKTIEEKVKLIAQAFLESYHGLSEETRQLALKFFSMYKDELGDLYYEIEKIINQK